MEFAEMLATDLVQLTSRLHFLRRPVGHIYLWHDAGGVTLIDSGVPGSGPLIAAAVRRVGADPADVRRIVLTHFHGDHASSAPEVLEWADPMVCAHRLDAPIIRGQAPAPQPVLRDWERPLFEQVVGDGPVNAPVPVRVDEELDDGDVLDIGAGAQVLAAPGHTDGNIALYLPTERILFSGDAIERTPDGQTIAPVFNLDSAVAEKSVRSLAKLDFDIMCPGHGEPLTENASTEVKATVAQMYEAG